MSNNRLYPSALLQLVGDVAERSKKKILDMISFVKSNTNIEKKDNLLQTWKLWIKKELQEI